MSEAEEEKSRIGVVRYVSRYLLLVLGKKKMIIKNFQLQAERGVTLVEYALLASLIAVVAIGGMRFVGQEAKETFGYIGCVQCVAINAHIPNENIVTGCHDIDEDPHFLAILEIMCS